MKKFFLALSTAAAFAASPSFALAAPATDPQAIVAVKAMFEAMELRKTMTVMYAQMQEAMPGMLRQQAAARIQADPKRTAEQKQAALAKLDNLVPGVAQGIGKILGDPALIDEMMDEMVPLYAANYTVDELRQLTAFYQTPVGKKTMALTPRLTAEGMALGQRVVMPRLEKLRQDMLQDMQKP